MSDFDTVLERLLMEPHFAARLAADPAAALIGYRLSQDEIELLHSQVGSTSSAPSGVEVRANQSSVFGMLSPLAGLAGGLTGIGDQLGGAQSQGGQSGAGSPGGQPARGVPVQGIGARPPASEGFGSAGGVSGPGQQADGTSGFGPADGTSGFGPAGGTSGFGPADGTSGFGPAVGPPLAAQGLGPEAGVTADGGKLGGFGDEIGRLIHHPDGGDSGGQGTLRPVQPPAEIVPPEGYRTRVDVDGDGTWDRHILRGRSDGGVDILVDIDGDGRVDFVGRDDDADGLVESASYDTTGDGFFDKTSYDDDGDGWLDRTVRQQPPR